jgi:hypothetical protein
MALTEAPIAVPVLRLFPLQKWTDDYPNDLPTIIRGIMYWLMDAKYYERGELSVGNWWTWYGS